jgi:DNA gyrase subunit B
MVYLEGEKDDIGIEIALQYNDSYNENVLLVREQHQHARGRHAPGRLQAALTQRDQQVRSTSRRGGLPRRTRKFELSGDDAREGLTAVSR